MNTKPPFDGIVCLAGEDWWYHNRGHYDMQIMRRFADRVPVLYVNSVVMQAPRVSEGRVFVKRAVRKLKSLRQGLKEVARHFYVYSPVTVPLHRRRWQRLMNAKALDLQLRRACKKVKIRNPLVWVVCLTACDAAMRLKPKALVYQRTDKMEAFREKVGVTDVQRLRSYDRRLKDESKLVIYVNRKMYEAEKGSCRKAYFSDHGVDFERFAMAVEEQRVPDELAAMRRPIVGAVGAMDDHKFDCKLAAAVARLMPDVSFVFIGPVTMNVEALRACPNVQMLGQRPYEVIADYGAALDVAILTCPVDAWTDAFNPIKLKEYLALGKPIVSTPFPALEPYKSHVRVGATAEEFASAVREALREKGEAQRAARRKCVEGDTWDALADRLWGLVCEGQHSDAER